MMRWTRSAWITGIIVGLAAVGCGFLAALGGPWWVAAVGLGLVVVILSVLHPELCAPLLLLAAMPLARPNILGDIAAPLGLGLAISAMLVAMLQDRGRSGVKWMSGTRWIVFWMGMGHAWLFVRAVISGSYADLNSHLLALVLNMGTVLSVVVVLRDKRRARLVGLFVILTTVAMSVSSAVTLIIWFTTGFSQGLIGSVTLNDLSYSLYFPFTTTLGSQSFGGVQLFRFVGYALEPGLMGMWCAFAYFFAPHVLTRGSRLVKSILVLGLAGTLSVAAVVVFIMTFIAKTFFVPRRAMESPLIKYGRAAIGLIALAVGLWVVVYAPFIGLNAKTERDPGSVEARGAATAAGFRALVESPILGGGAVEDIGSVNLIASVAAFGVPFLICISFTFLAPLMRRETRAQLTGPLLVLYLTLVVAQPALNSTWIFVAALLAVAFRDPVPSVSGLSRIAVSELAES